MVIRKWLARSLEGCHNTWRRSRRTTDVHKTHTACQTPALRCNQLIPVKKVVNEKEQLEKGLEEEVEKNNLTTPY
jgi:hypothetical protein